MVVGAAGLLDGRRATTHWYSVRPLPLSRSFAMTTIANRLAVWRHERVGIELEPGIDEVSLALVADAWSRTYRSHAVAYSTAGGEILTRNGVRIVPDARTDDWPIARRVSTYAELKPAEALDQALRALGARYGERTADVVAMQLEYARPQET